MELICSPGRERGEGFGAAEGRAGLPLWEDDEEVSRHLVPADGQEGQRGGAGLRSFCSPGANRDRLCLIVKGPEL